MSAGEPMSFEEALARAQNLEKDRERLVIVCHPRDQAAVARLCRPVGLQVRSTWEAEEGMVAVYDRSELPG